MFDDTKKSDALARIARELEQASCPLRAGATQAVPGEGNANADVFFLGEAPGKKEDETGRPFVGAAGKILNTLLENVGMRREDVFITSIEKFRPPKNRDPKPEEILACFPYLEQQIAVIEPAFVVTLGRHALRRMLAYEAGEDVAAPSMDELHGKPIATSRGYTIFPVHHPAAMIYNRKLQSFIEADFRTLADLVDQRRSK